MQRKESLVSIVQLSICGPQTLECPTLGTTRVTQTWMLKAVGGLLDGDRAAVFATPSCSTLPTMFFHIHVCFPTILVSMSTRLTSTPSTVNPLCPLC